MITNKNKRYQAIEQTKSIFLDWKAKHPELISTYADRKMVGCIFVQQLSARKYHVGWRFTSQNTNAGDIQMDNHTAYDKQQHIVWVDK